MIPQQYAGVGVAVVTPFKKNKEVDFDALENLIQYLLAQGVDYLVALGTTSESPCLTASERNQILEVFKKQVQGRVPLVLGLGGNNTQAVIDAIQQTNLLDVSGLLLVTPYYNKPSQEGLYRHFEAIANICPIDIILYNVPGRTGVNMNAATTLKLAHDFRNIVAVKEASGNLEQMMQIIKDKPAYFEVISGDDALVLPQIAAGLNGVISVAANVLPGVFSKMVHLAMEGKFAEARTIHLDLMDFYQLLFVEGNPAGAKCALAELDIIQNELRLPLIPMSEENAEKMQDEIRRIENRYSLK